MHSNKVVLVTGSSRGLGRRILKEFAKTGYSVVINYNKSESQASDLLKELISEKYNAIKVKADVSSSKEVQKMFSVIMCEFGRLDVLVNNAAIIMDKTIFKMSDEEWQGVLSVNLSGCFYTIREFVKYALKQKDGSIINISSIVGIRGNIGEANYSAAKSGIIGLTKTAARELGRFNIRVNCVLPGFHFDTDMGHQGGKDYYNKILEESVLGRTTDIDELARFIVFLSQLSSVSGQVFNLDSRIV